jgi:hypothetical protein
MLAALGFADKDKKNARHDWAIQFLMDPANFFAPGAVLMSKPVFHPEWHLTKGEGQYQTTVGFIDLLVDVKLCIKKGEGTEIIAHCYFINEIKIEPVAAGDILRQMRLYGDYVKQRYDVRSRSIKVLSYVYADFEMHADDIKMLDTGGVVFRTLSKKGFDKYVENRESTPVLGKP